MKCPNCGHIWEEDKQKLIFTTTPSNDEILVKTAKKAKNTGNRKDLQDYLKLRRELL